MRSWWVVMSLALVIGCQRASTKTPRAATAIPPAQSPATQQAHANSEADSGPIATVAYHAPPGNESPTAPLPNPLATPIPVVERLPNTPPAPPQTWQLDFFQAAETALAQNPDLLTQRQAIGVGRGALGVAQTYPFNPWVQVQVTPWQHDPANGPGTVAHYVLLMQQIQLARQPQYRAQNAAAMLQSVHWNLMQAELLNVAQTQRLYFTALYQRGLSQLADDNARLNQELLRIVERQTAAGQAAPADLAIVRLDAQTSRKQSQLADANYQTALLDLRRHLNVPLDIGLELQGALNECRWLIPAGETLACPCDISDVAQLTAGRPDVQAAHADLVAAQANLRLACASRRPDLIAGPYYQRNEGNVSFIGLRAQSDIPVWNTGMPLVRQREAEVRQRQVAWQQLHERATLEAQAALDRYRRSHEFIEHSPLDQPGYLPQELRRLEEQFRAGEIDIVRVITARTSLMQWRRAQLDTLQEVAQAAAAATAATGLSPDVFLGETSNRD